jgi:3-hydroxyanthranilate 3,4-dioxygenase
MEAKRVVQLFQELETSWGSFDEFPALSPGVDPTPHLSRNTVSQPFFIVSDRDETLINLSGEGEIWFAGETPERTRLAAGDSVYLPAGIPSRLITHTTSLQVRFKAQTPGREAAVWYCGQCSGVVHWHAIGPEVEIPQEQYWDAVEIFNSSVATRSCPACGTEHSPAELGDIAWPEVAKAIRALREGEQ